MSLECGIGFEKKAMSSEEAENRFDSSLQEYLRCVRKEGTGAVTSDDSKTHAAWLALAILFETMPQECQDHVMSVDRFKIPPHAVMSIIDYLSAQKIAELHGITWECDAERPIADRVFAMVGYVREMIAGRTTAANNNSSTEKAA